MHFPPTPFPTHLLTREALRGYLAHLAPHGMLLIHISNRHLELPKVVAAVGATEGLTTLVKTDRNAIDFTADLRAAAMVAVLARRDADFGTLLGAEGWEKTEAGGVVAWTDDYSDIIGAMLRKKFGTLGRLLQQHGQRLDHRKAPHFAAPDIAVALLAVRKPAILGGDGEMHKPDRFLGRAAAGAGDAGDRHGEVDIGARERAARHRQRGLTAHRAMLAQRRLGHAEHRHLGGVRIGDEAAVDHVG